MTAPRRPVALTPAQWAKVLSYLGMAEIDNAELLEDICKQLGVAVPLASAKWLAERRAR